MPDSEVDRYATVKYKEGGKTEFEVEELLEKMPLGHNPSNMAQFGRFVFSYDVIQEAEKLQTGKDDELWVADILNNLAKQGKSVIAQPVDGEWVTTGDPLRYLKTTLKFAMQREDLKEDLVNYIREEIN